jgi:hydroxyethylthiazole kinase-like uncharacterized protein yjeF
VKTTGLRKPLGLTKPPSPIMRRPVTASIVKKLYTPPPKSHKGENGVVLIIGGSERYHGAPIFAAKIASKIVDLVYFSSVPENNRLIAKMKLALADFIAIPRSEVFKIAEKVDAILIGPGMGINAETRKITNQMLRKFPKNKFVLDADALKVLDKKLLGPNIIVTPHAGEFEILFGKKASGKTAGEMAKKYNCTVVLKGAVDYICDASHCLANSRVGNAGMTKGGTGDVLAGLTTALAAKNDLFLSACAAAYINRLAGDRLFKRVSYYYNASDLIDEILQTLFQTKGLDRPFRLRRK